jgi:hypothetical protein
VSRIAILDPTAAPPEVDADPGPDAGALAGRTVGIRYDTAWRSFEWALDEWKRELEAAGIDVQLWCAGNRVGEEGERTAAELEQFAESVDVAIVGLGN